MAPRKAFEDRGRHSGRSPRDPRSVKKSYGNVFLRFLEAKYTDCQGFKHANFVDLIWPFGASGRSWGNLGWPWELQRRFGELRGGLERKGSGSGGLQEAPRNRKTRFWSAARFSQDAPEPTFIVVLAIFSKTSVFFKLSPMGFPGKLKEGLQRCVLRSSGLPGGPRES